MIEFLIACLLLLGYLVGACVFATVVEAWVHRWGENRPIQLTSDEIDALLPPPEAP